MRQLVIKSVQHYLMHGVTMKFIEAQQAKLCNTYKNTRLKLLRTNMALRFNKICRLKHLKPNYIHFKTSGNKLQDKKKTTSNALRFRINQENKFLYCKKQNLNTQLYHLHIECANYCNSAWQHIQDSFDSRSVFIYFRMF